MLRILLDLTRDSPRGILTCLVLLVLIYVSAFTVEQQTCAIIERLGRFIRFARPGINFRIPLIEARSGEISLRIHQLDVEVETKTRDNVFIKTIVAIQYKVLESKIYEAYYTLHDPVGQIKAFVFDLVRAQVPLMELDDVFSRKDDVADAVKRELRDPMSDFGYEIIKALVIDINPDENVKAAMNEINTAQRMRVAANERGEAEKILKVKQAEAEAEAAVLRGKGVAGQREAIISGLSQSIDMFTRQTGSTPSNAMDMVLAIQYIDALKEIGGQSKSNVVFVQHSPVGQNSVTEQIRESILATELMKGKEKS
jgi:regulator of protease activity HflC (stomatin/prohibitin superfamily)